MPKKSTKKTSKKSTKNKKTTSKTNKKTSTKAKKTSKKSSKTTIKSKKSTQKLKKSKKSTKLSKEAVVETIDDVEEIVNDDIFVDEEITNEISDDFEVPINDINKEQIVEVKEDNLVEEDKEEIMGADDEEIIETVEDEIVEIVNENEEIREISDDEAEKFADIDLDDDEKLKAMLQEFSGGDLDDLDMDELDELEDAIESVKSEIDDADSEDLESIGIGNEIVDPLEGWGLYYEEDPFEGWGLYVIQQEYVRQEISEDLEAKIQEELEKKRKKKKIITPEIFKKYCSDRRNKIWYHALWYLVFEMDDHQAKKLTLYEALKEVTSKSAIDPLPEHKFYFGLGFILRLSINEFKVIDFLGDTLKINKNVGVDLLYDLLTEVGVPISERPKISEEKKKDMFLDFLTDDFSDI